jgi:hypothetical protein
MLTAMSFVVICWSARGRGRAAARNKAKVKRREMDSQQITTIAIQSDYSTTHTFSLSQDFPCLGISFPNSLSQPETLLSHLKAVVAPKQLLLLATVIMATSQLGVAIAQF